MPHTLTKADLLALPIDPSMKPPTDGSQSPWGAVQDTWEVVPGHIVRVDTPSHGGYWVSGRVLDGMPALLQTVEPFAGKPWYEEDCDWALVALAFPDCFDDRALRGAVVTAKLDYVGWHKTAESFLANTPEGQAIAKRVADWEAVNAHKFEQGSAGTNPRGSGIFVNWHRLDGGAKLTTYFPSFTAVPTGLQVRSALEPFLKPPPEAVRNQPRVVQTAGCGHSSALTPSASGSTFQGHSDADSGL